MIDQKGATNLYIGTTYLLIHYYDNNRISHQLLHLSKRRATSGNGEGEYVRAMDRQENYRTNIGGGGLEEDEGDVAIYMTCGWE